MRKALILGTNAGQADIINYLVENNWEVHACGYKEEGPGCKLAHQFHLVNTIDIEAVKELAQNIKADIVYSVSSDSAMRSATKVSEELGLPTLLDSNYIDLFHYKDKLRNYLNENKINTVGYKKITDYKEVDDWGIFPCVVKPADSQGQRGVQLVKQKEDILEAVKFAQSQSGSGTVILEEYLKGIEISTNIIVQNNKIIINEFTERLVHGTEHFGLPRGHSIPVRSVSKEIVLEASKIVENLQ